MVYLVSAVISVFIGANVSRLPLQIEEENKKCCLKGKHLNRNFLIFLSALGPLLLSALRYGIGTDYFYTYIPQFNVIVNGGRTYYEYGFYLLNKLIAQFTNNGQWLIVITSILFIWMGYYQLFKNASNYAISLVLFFLSYNYFTSLH